jgi:hypothetical protein
MKKKYSIKEKQGWVAKLTDIDNFDADLDLFKTKFPTHNLNRDLARVNKVNKQRLSSNMIYHLLDVVSAEEIIANREAKSESGEQKPEEVIIENAEQAKEILKAVNIDIENEIFSEEFFAETIGKTAQEVVAFAAQTFAEKLAAVQSETVTEETKTETVTEETKPETVTEETKTETVTEETKSETVTEETKPETVTEETKSETVTEETKPETATEEKTKETEEKTGVPETKTEETDKKKDKNAKSSQT